FPPLPGTGRDHCAHHQHPAACERPAWYCLHHHPCSTVHYPEPAERPHNLHHIGIGWLCDSFHPLSGTGRDHCAHHKHSAACERPAWYCLHHHPCTAVHYPEATERSHDLHHIGIRRL
ncbi:hypothetical protein ACHAPJ_013646, partial [Fusarium lateritium]